MEIIHHFGAGVYIKETRFKAGECGEKHVHDYDHLSQLVSGTAGVQVDDDVKIYTGPLMMTVEKNKFHQVMAITDVVWNCIHATDCTDPDVIDNVLTRRASYAF